MGAIRRRWLWRDSDRSSRGQAARAESRRGAQDGGGRAIRQSKGCDLIVMASHGRHGISALVLGSETVKVLTHSKIPVLVQR
jgi:nucleotide-binding universal stress UspA family protein